MHAASESEDSGQAFCRTSNQPGLYPAGMASRRSDHWDNDNRLNGRHVKPPAPVLLPFRDVSRGLTGLTARCAKIECFRFRSKRCRADSPSQLSVVVYCRRCRSSGQDLAGSWRPKTRQGAGQPHAAPMRLSRSRHLAATTRADRNRALTCLPNPHRIVPHRSEPHHAQQRIARVAHGMPFTRSAIRSVGFSSCDLISR